MTVLTLPWAANRAIRYGIRHQRGIAIMNYKKLWLTLDEVREIHPIHDASRRRAEAAGLFPRRVMLSANIAAWPTVEVEAWLRDPHSWQAKQVA
jgi:predicted DNA-binding transcriptional regulator AlpA